jgi:hypothetical protein
MAQFASEYVGGPADGLPLVMLLAPREGDTTVHTDQGGTHHAYVFRCEGWLSPKWRYAGVMHSGQHTENRNAK